MPEGEGSTGLMIECDLCERWYHPHCVHRSCKDVRRGVAAFACPLCLYSQGSASELVCLSGHNFVALRQFMTIYTSNSF